MKILFVSRRFIPPKAETMLNRLRGAPWKDYPRITDMKASEIRKKDKKELEKDLKNLKQNLGELRFKLAANKLKNVKQIRNMKKDIARILTITEHKT